MQKTKVVIAMSGGVDSSLAAALLIEQGYDVIGVTMQIWPAEEQAEGSCCALSAVEDARRVADKLGIPYYVMNFKDLFKETVISNFCSEYVAGRTPNPCIMCNRLIKFEALLKKAIGLGAEYIATGHYAKILYDQERKRYILKRAADDAKDQTYVLYNLTQKQLKHTMMPLADFTKTETRRLAAELDLKVANKPDSQEICFVTDNNYRRFLEENLQQPIKPGPFLDTAGNVLGQHEGIPFYTVGQRKGLGIALGTPMYVVEIDPTRNAVILGTNEEVFAKELISIDNNFILIPELSGEMVVEAKIRYAAKPSPAVISPCDEGVKVVFEHPQRAITPGQSVVFYQGDYVVGGGIIKRQLAVGS